MSTTPHDPETPTEGATPAADDARQLAGVGDTQPLAAAGDTQPLVVPAPATPTPAPVPPAAAGVAPPTGVPAAVAAGAPAPSGQVYAGQQATPYTGPTYPAQPYQQPYAYGPRPLAPGQGYPGPAYPPQPYPPAGLQHAGVPLGAGPAGPLPGGPAGSAAPRRRAWIPVVVTLVIVAMLAVAAVIASTRLTARDEAAGAVASSMASIGQSGSTTLPVAGSSAENPDWAAVASAVQASVVSIAVRTNGGEALGSGVVVDSSGHVVTNNHVVEGLAGDTVQVTLSDGRIYDAKVAGTDASTDLAVVTIQNPPSDLAVAQFGDSAQVRVGDPVMAVGNPLGLANTVTTGIVSAVDRPVSPSASGQTTGAVTNAIQIDAAVNPGNSGGPLFNVHGQVIGITSSIATTSSDSGSIGLGFAIPVDLVHNIAGQLIAKGSAEHAYIGVSLRDGTATADGVTRRGAEVGKVTDGSPAAQAGIQVGDVVVAIDGKPVGGSDSLAAYVRAMAAGEKATLLVVRDGKTLSVEVTLAAQPDTATQQGSQGGDQSQQGQGDGQSLPNGMTPDQLFQWLQQHGFGQGGTGN